MSDSAPSVRLATRGSDLALAQTRRVAEMLRDRRFQVDIIEVETTGDRLDDELIENLGTTGAFVRSLDRRVLAGEADFAVHSMKDMPTESPTELVVSAVPERGPPADVLVTPDGATLETLPDNARVGTASVRRQAQLLAERPDLEVVPLRGNVDTRVEKLLAPWLQAEHENRLEGENGDAGKWFENLTEIERTALGREVEKRLDAIVLAEAGLERSGLIDAVPTSVLPPAKFVPAPAQGALAIVGRESEVSERIRSILDFPRSRLECAVERAVLAGIGGGCIAPIGVYARLRGPVVHVSVRVLSGDGSETIAATRELSATRAVENASTFADDLNERGARELVEAAKNGDEPPRRGYDS